MFNTRCLFSEGSHNNNMRGIMSPSLCKVSPSSHQYTHTWTRRHHLFTHIYVYALRRVVDGWWSYIHEKEVRAIGVGFVTTRERHGAIWGERHNMYIRANRNDRVNVPRPSEGSYCSKLPLFAADNRQTRTICVHQAAHAMPMRWYTMVRARALSRCFGNGRADSVGVNAPFTTRRSPYTRCLGMGAI